METAASSAPTDADSTPLPLPRRCRRSRPPLARDLAARGSISSRAEPSWAAPAELICFRQPDANVPRLAGARPIAETTFSGALVSRPAARCGAGEKIDTRETNERTNWAAPFLFSARARAWPPPRSSPALYWSSVSVRAPHLVSSHCISPVGGAAPLSSRVDERLGFVRARALAVS